MQTQAQQIIDRCQQAFAKAKELYGLDLSKVGIRFDLKGRAAGMACARGGFFERTYFMRFNRDMMQREAFDHVLNNTVPHEVAHIVCFMNPQLGRNHDAGWERVCLALGGSGATRHQEDVVYGKGRTYEYTTTLGHKVRLSEQRHKGVQRGGALSYRGGKGIVNKSCAYEIVGYQGRTLTTPIAGKAPAPQPVQTVQSVQPVRPVLKSTPVLPPIPDNVPKSIPKSEIARRLVKAAYERGDRNREVVIQAIITCTQFSRALATGYFKGACQQQNIPVEAFQ